MRAAASRSKSRFTIRTFLARSGLGGVVLAAAFTLPVSPVFGQCALFEPNCKVDLGPELQARVDALIADVERTPTTAATIAERMPVLWEWANAVSMQSGFVPKNLPLVAFFGPYPRPGAQPPQNQVEAVDDYVRYLSWIGRSDDQRFRPDAPLGFLWHAEGTGVAPVFEAGSWVTYQLNYEVGPVGIAEGGGIVISNQFAGGYGRLQTTDPAGDHFVSARVEKEGIRLEHDTHPIWGPYGGFRGPAGFPMLRVRGGDLGPGDTIVLTYGDTSGGGRGLRIGNFSNDRIALPLHVDPGDGRAYELAPATYEVTGGAAERVHGFAPSVVGVGESLVISVRVEDFWYNRATRQIPGLQVFLGGEQVGELPAGEAIHLMEVEAVEEGVLRYTFASPDGQVTGAANPVWVQADPARRLYWGETHGHSGFAEGQGTPEGYFRFARDDARLDFVTLSEHDLWLTDGLWAQLTAAVEEYHDEGRMLVFAGYEWTSPRQRGGHHNVFFRRTDMERIGVQTAPNLSDLYRGLRAVHDTKDVLIIPHAHQNGDWRQNDFDMENLIEIMSGHGTFEWFGSRYLEQGFRVGFIAASDDHRGHPGYSPGHPPGATGRRSNIFQFGGLAGVWAPALLTDAVFDGLKARRAHATTGAQRIILDVALNGEPMGTELDLTERRVLEGRAIGTGPIRRVDLIRNGEVAATFDTRGAGGSALPNGQFEALVSFHSETWVDIRDNPRGQRPWRGTVTVEGARLIGGRLTGTPLPPDRFEVDGAVASFDLTTRGSRRSLALVLEGDPAAVRLSFALDAGVEFGVAPTQVRTPQQFAAASFALALPAAPGTSSDARGGNEHVFQEGEYRDSIRVDFLEGLRDDVTFRFSDVGDREDWYYVRVEQADGHLAWSSPWWVGGERPR